MKLDLSNIPGLTELSADHKRDTLAGSKFALPPGFDSSKYASKWVEQGPNVIEAQQPVVLASVGVSADGWQVYKQPKVKLGEKLPEAPVEGAESESPLGDAKAKPRPVFEPVTRAVGKAVFVLMFRPKQLQQVINVIYSNESREMVSREVNGETSAVNPGNDQGIMTHDDMKRFKRMFPDEQEAQDNGYLKPTPLSHTPAQAVELTLA